MEGCIITLHHDASSQTNPCYGHVSYKDQGREHLWHLLAFMTQLHMDHWILQSYSPFKIFVASYDQITLLDFYESPLY